MGVGQGAMAPLAMTRPDPGFWAGKRVLLTGHTGFKGAWTAIWLSRLGATVSGLALPPDQTPALYDLAEVGRLLTSSLVDLRDLRSGADRLQPDRRVPGSDPGAAPIR